MDSNEDYTELLLKKIRKQTSTEEDLFIDEILKQNPELEAEYIELTRMAEGTRLYQYQKEAEAFFGKERGSTNFPGQMGLWSKAAAVLLIVGTVFAGYMTFSKNYLPGIKVDAGVVRSAADPEKPESSDADEQKAAFERFVIGQGYYSSGDFSRAIVSFEEALKAKNLRSQIREALEWHLCVAYLSDKQPEKADFWMKVIESRESPRYKINPLNKAKVKWQILVMQLFN